MKLGTIVFNNKIYNLDYMSREEIEVLLKNVEDDKAKNIVEGKKIIDK